MDGGSRWLKLDKSIQIGDKIVTDVRVENGASWENGKVVLNGRLNLEESPERIFPPRFIAVLSGVTNRSIDEPRYDGTNFTNSKDDVLEQLGWQIPDSNDLPSVLVALDHASDTAFVGQYGLPNVSPERRDENPFRGFYEKRAISLPTAEEIANPPVAWSTPTDTTRAREEWPHSASTGKELEQVGGPKTIQGKRWFIDHATQTIYGFSITSPTQRTMDHVIHPERIGG